MTLDMGIAAKPAAANGALVRESTTASFAKDVIEASATQPVLVDFWAPWCGPCRQLGPAIEKIVTELKGKVKLVKINVDENQALAGQMGVQSIPAVFAFAGGKPVDGFMGALPESEIRRFIDKILAAAGPGKAGTEPDLSKAFDAAQEAMDKGDFGAAEQIYAMILQNQPESLDALFGLGALYLKANHLDAVKAILAELPEDGKKRPEYASLNAAIQLAEEAASLGSVEEIEKRLAADENDHQARFDLAIALNARGSKIEAAKALIDLMHRDRAWNEDGARKKLLELLDAWGPKDPATLKGRRMLSVALFS